MPLALFLHLGPYIAMAVMGLGLFGLWEMHKVDAAAHKDDQAVIQQGLKDRAESAKQYGILQGKLENIDAKTAPTIQYVTSAPVTSGCGPTVGFAVDRLRDDRNGSKVPAGPKPSQPPRVSVPLHSASTGK